MAPLEVIGSSQGQPAQFEVVSIREIVSGVRVMAGFIWRIRRIVLGPYAHGTRKTTPDESLNLQPGESIQVRSIDDIRDSLNNKATTAGCDFSRTCACYAVTGPASGTGSTRSLSMERERCDSSAIPSTWKGLCAAARTLRSVVVLGRSSPTGGKSGFAARRTNDASFFRHQ